MKNPILIACMAALALMPKMASAGQILTYLPQASGPVAFNGTTVTGSNIPIEAFLFAANSYGSDTLNATLSFSATAAGSAQEIFGFLFYQPLTNISLIITADTPVSGHSNILSVTANSGDFSGTSAGFSLSATTNGAFNDGVTFTSDFINVAGLSNLGFQILIGAPDPDLSINNGVLSSFQSVAGPGTFMADAPEPASFALLGGGLLVLAGLRRPRSRA